MKKAMTFMLACAMTLSLAACGSTRNGTQTVKDEWEPRKEKMTQEEADTPPATDQLVTIETKLGAVQGVQLDGYREYRGIRYAAAERWEPAVAVTTAWEGVYDATTWGDRSMQFQGIYGFADSVINQFYADEALVSIPAEYSEDSLNLNIWAPDDAENCPVLLYIHGGAYMTGSNTDTSTDGEAYAKHGIVMVSINYRLGPWANIHGDGYDGDLALTDQLTAIRWVRDNIADYGGDPSKITIMGESAGAKSVQNLLISPLVEDGLIAGAIMMSGGGSIKDEDPMSSAVMDVIWQQVKNAGGYSSVSEMKDLSARELFEVWALNLGDLSSVAATPIRNGVALTESINSALENGNVKNVPTMIGMLSEDMYPYTLYKAAVEYGKKRAEADGEPVYLYYFDREQPGDTTFGAFHGADLYYVFGTLYRNWRPFDDTDYRISHNMIDYISNFVKTGDPNGSGLAVWEPATVENQQFMHFGDTEAAMIAPDKSLLSDNQYNRPAFPYADKVKYPGVDDNESSDPEEGTPVTPEELLGEWVISGWDVLSDGSHVSVDYEAVFAFEETQRHYYVDGALNNTRDYYWKDDLTVVILMDGVEYECGVYWGRDGYMMLEDPRYGIVYTCTRAGGDLPKPFYEDVTVISGEAIRGTWDITGWIVKADGSFSGVQGQTFVFEDDLLSYYIGEDLVSASTYFFEDRYNIGLRSAGATREDEYGTLWTVYLNADGQLLIEDPAYAIIYVCNRVGGSETETGTAVDLPTPFYDDAIKLAAGQIVGTWNITGWTVKADGSFAPVEGQTFIFEENRLSYYIGDSLVSVSTYYFDDAYNIGLRAEGAAQSEAAGLYWTVYLNDKGQLLIEDPTFAIIYVCEQVQEEADSDFPKPFYDDAVAVSNAEIQGTWNITGWTVKADGSFAPVEGQTFVFEKNRLSYYIGDGLASVSTYYFDDAYNIGLRADGAQQSDAYGVLWTLYLDQQGRLLIEDPSYGIIYICEKA